MGSVWWWYRSKSSQQQQQNQHLPLNGTSSSSSYVYNSTSASNSVHHHPGLGPANYLRRLAISHLILAVITFSLQIVVTAMATLYKGLYLWTWDGPTLAKSSTGILSGVICLACGLIQLNASKNLRRSNQTQRNTRFCTIKILSCFSLLMGLLLFGISIYLSTLLYKWWSVYSEEQYRQYIEGPVSFALGCNISQILAAILQICLAFVGLLCL